MMTLTSNHWTRRGVSLVFEAHASAFMPTACKFLPIDAWLADAEAPPPSNAGRTLVVTGLDAHLEALPPQDREDWLRTMLVVAVSRFRNTHERQGALIFSVHNGRARFRIDEFGKTATWILNGADSQISVERSLFGDEPCCLARIIDPQAEDLCADGPAWIGLHLMSPS